uniref:Uncharacterized protein n=1 Tax=Burkholderia phage vB_BgluM-SURPRISE13 TaxID=3159457 RepID=A0AAU7PF80_9VIRU
MINLFDRVYLRHDNVLARGEGQKKLIISPKVKEVVYVTDTLQQQQAGILGAYESLSDAFHYAGDQNAFWAGLANAKAKVIIIADRVTVATLLIQYWKAIFKQTTDVSLFHLYEVTVNNESLHTHRPTEKRTHLFSPNSTDGEIPKLTLDEFTAIYNAAEPACLDYSSETALKSLPFEYLLMSYLADAKDEPVKRVLFQKVDAIMRSNIVAKLIGGREELMFESHNYYLLEPGEQEHPITDPIAHMRASGHLAWVMDDAFVYGNEDEILKKYSLDQIKFFFEQIKRLVVEDDSIFMAVDCVKNKRYARLIEYDIADHRGNFFGTGAFVNKINGLLVSYAYQLKRLGMAGVLEQYELK